MPPDAVRTEQVTEESSNVAKLVRLVAVNRLVLDNELL